MSDNILYHLVQPSNQKSSPGGYREAENVDFDLAFEGRKFISGSLRLEGDVQVFSDGGTTRVDPTAAAASDCKIDGRVGAHSFCSSFVTSFQNVGNVENLQSYPRLVAMKGAGQMSKNDMNHCEFREKYGRAFRWRRDHCIYLSFTKSPHDVPFSPRRRSNGSSSDADLPLHKKFHDL